MTRSFRLDTRLNDLLFSKSFTMKNLWKKPLFDYPKQTDPLAFGKWMANRAMVEQFRG